MSELKQYKKDIIKRLKSDIKESEKYLRIKKFENDFYTCTFIQNDIENFEYFIDLIKNGLNQ